MGMAEKIKEKRLEKGLTQEAFAKKLALQKKDIIKWESGQIDDMKSSTIYNIAQVLECSLSDIMCFNERDLDIRRISKHNHDMTYKEIKMIVESFDYYFSDDYDDTDIEE